jgi:hypothetical protein
MTTGRINQVTTFLDGTARAAPTPIVVDPEAHFPGQEFIKWCVDTNNSAIIHVWHDAHTETRGPNLPYFPASHILGSQSPRHQGNAGHVPLRELPTTGNGSMPSRGHGGFSSSLECCWFGHKQVTHTFLTLQSDQSDGLRLDQLRLQSTCTRTRAHLPHAPQ